MTVTVTGTNDQPTLSVTNLSATEDGTSVSGTPTFADADSTDVLTFTVTQPAEGSASIDPSTGVYTFTPGTDFQDLAAGETRDVTFNVTVTDDSGTANNSTTETVTVTVTGTNDAPVLKAAANMVGLAAEYYGVNGQIGNLTQFKDIVSSTTPDATFTSSGPNYALGSGNIGNGDNLQTWLGDDASTLSADPATTSDGGIFMHGQVYLEAGSYVFKSHTDDGFELTVNGDNAGTYTGNRAPGTTTDTTPVVITEAGYVPVELFWWDQGGRYVLEVSVAKDGGDFVEFTTDNFSMLADVLLTETDSSLSTTGSFDVCDVDFTDEVTASIEGTVTVSGFDIGPIDVASMLSITSTTPVIGNDETDGTVTYDFNSGSEAFDFLPLGESVSITYTIAVTDGTDTVIQPVVITITGTNDAPIANAQTAAATEGGSVITGQLTSSDVDGATPSYALADGQDPVPGLTLNSDGSYSFDPADPAYQTLTDGEQTTVSVNYTVDDGNGGTSTSTLTIALTGVNNPPESGDFEVGVSGSAVQINFDPHVSDVEDDHHGDLTQVRIESLPDLGSLVHLDGSPISVGDLVLMNDVAYIAPPEGDRAFLLGQTGGSATLASWGDVNGDGAAEQSVLDGLTITTSVNNGTLTVYGNQQSHIGNGIADDAGQGINQGDVLTVDFGSASVTSFTAGLTGMGGHFYEAATHVTITVNYVDGGSQTFEYFKANAGDAIDATVIVGPNGTDGLVTSGDPIRSIEFGTLETNASVTGSNWELQFVQGELNVESSFTYTPVDSDNQDGNSSTVTLSVQSGQPTVSSALDAPPVFEVAPTSDSGGMTQIDPNEGVFVFAGRNGGLGPEVSTVEAGQSITQIVISVSGVQIGTEEQLAYGGMMALNDGNSGSGDQGGRLFDFSVSASGNTSTVTFNLGENGVGGWSTDDVEHLIANLCYLHGGADATDNGGLRTVRIESMSDNGQNINSAHFDDVSVDLFVGYDGFEDEGDDNIHQNDLTGDDGGTEDSEVIRFSDIRDSAADSDDNGPGVPDDTLLLSGNGGDDLFMAFDRDFGTDDTGLVKALIDDFDAVVDDSDGSENGHDTLDLSALLEANAGSEVQVTEVGSDTVVKVVDTANSLTFAEITLQGVSLDPGTTLDDLVNENIIKIV